MSQKLFKAIWIEFAKVRMRTTEVTALVMIIK